MIQVQHRNLRFEFKQPFKLTNQERCLWSDLVRTKPDLCRAFLTFDFANAVTECVGEVLVVVAYWNETPQWFMPLQRHPSWLGMFGVFEPVGGVMSDYFGAVGESECNIVPKIILKASAGKIGAILFSHLDETQTKLGLTGVEPRVGLRTRIGDSATNYWEELRERDKKLVYDTERREKKFLKDHGPLSFEWHSSNIKSDLQKLVEMKSAQYSRTGKLRAPLFDERNINLLNRLALSESLDCVAVLSVLRCGDELVAVHLGLRCHEVLHIWFPVYEAKYANYSPGRILLKYIIQNSSKHGVQLLDRGEGDTQAKRDFANEEHYYFRGMWFVNSFRGFFAKIATSIYWRL